MRKFLIVFVAVTMVAFLFGGCLGVTPDPVIPVENNPPEITSSAITSGKVGVVYNYDVNATDPEGDTLTYSLTEKPLGMSIIATTGIISWTPTDAGLFGVGVKVSDGEFFDTQNFSITVAAVDEEEPEPEPELPSVTPVIAAISNIDLYSSDTQYINEDEADDGIFVEGYAPKYSEVKIYIDGEVVSTGYAYGLIEEFKVFITKTKLGEDGEKVLYATATEIGLVESADSTAYTFILDTVAPKIEEVTASLDEETVTVTFDEALDEDTAEWTHWWTGRDHWTVDDVTDNSDDIDEDSPELTAPKVVELDVDFGNSDIGYILKVSCEDIEDLAGNKTDDFDYCWVLP